MQPEKAIVQEYIVKFAMNCNCSWEKVSFDENEKIELHKFKLKFLVNRDVLYINRTCSNDCKQIFIKIYYCTRDGLTSKGFAYKLVKLV